MLVRKTKNSCILGGSKDAGIINKHTMRKLNHNIQTFWVLKDAKCRSGGVLAKSG